jgi:hypothetical protein
MSRCGGAGDGNRDAGTSILCSETHELARQFVWAGIVVFLALLVGAGTWWQLWVSRKVGGWASNRFERLDPAGRQRLEPRIRSVPGGKQFLAKSESEDASGASSANRSSYAWERAMGIEPT